MSDAYTDRSHVGDSVSFELTSEDGAVKQTGGSVPTDHAAFDALLAEILVQLKAEAQTIDEASHND